MKTIKLELEENAAEFYIASLARGILEGMKSGALPLEIGIWSLGRPAFRSATLATSISAELTAVLESFDELNALAELGIDPSPLLRRMTDALNQCQRSLSIDSSNFVIRVATP